MNKCNTETSSIADYDVSVDMFVVDAYTHVHPWAEEWEGLGGGRLS